MTLSLNFLFVGSQEERWILQGTVRFWFTHTDSDEHKHGCCLVVTTGSDFSVLDAVNVFRKIFIFPQSWEKVN